MLFIVAVLSIPVYGYCIWSLYEPEESFFFMEKWRYKEVPELSNLQIKLITPQQYSNNGHHDNYSSAACRAYSHIDIQPF